MLYSQVTESVQDDDQSIRTATSTSAPMFKLDLGAKDKSEAKEEKAPTPRTGELKLISCIKHKSFHILNFMH